MIDAYPRLILGNASLRLALPCDFNLGLARAVLFSFDAFPEGIGQQDTLILRQFVRDLSDFLEGVRHGEIVARF